MPSRSDPSMPGWTRITRDEFIRLGGQSNPRLARVTRGGRWAYFSR